jgi:type IV secretory pathway VirB6-like protein
VSVVFVVVVAVVVIIIIIVVVVILRYYIRKKITFTDVLKRKNLTVFTVNSPFIICQSKLLQGEPETPDSFLNEITFQSKVKKFINTG